MRYIVRTVSHSNIRLENVKILNKIIPQLEIIVDNERDGYKSFKKSCEIVNNDGAVFLEDDILLCNNFCEILENIIKEKGYDKVYNFYEKPKKYIETSYVGGSNFLWMQCIYLPPKLPMKIQSYYNEFKETQPEKYKGMATDYLIAYALTKEKIKYWRIRPTLVQHLDFPSVIGNRPKNRQSPYFIDDLIKKGVDYNDLQYAK